jgi:hypothetical protein
MDPDPTPFFSDFKDAKKKFIYFSYNLPAGIYSSVFKAKRGKKQKKPNIVNISYNLFWQTLTAREAPFCQKNSKSLYPLNTFMRKGKCPEPDPDPYL